MLHRYRINAVLPAVTPTRVPKECSLRVVNASAICATGVQDTTIQDICSEIADIHANTPGIAHGAAFTQHWYSAGPARKVPEVQLGCLPQRHDGAAGAALMGSAGMAPIRLGASAAQAGAEVPPNISQVAMSVTGTPRRASPWRQSRPQTAPRLEGAAHASQRGCALQAVLRTTAWNPECPRG